MSKQYREFWINFFMVDENKNETESNVYIRPPKHWPKKPKRLDVHVIEHSAYSDLKAENEKLREFNKHFGHADKLACGQVLIENTKLKAQLDVARDALADCHALCEGDLNVINKAYLEKSMRIIINVTEEALAKLKGGE